ncbi:unnamed protein product [Larinioides sclopetarius]|uniref:Uncharacterized protein n=1 Tax=Larinioides sclopetarius TaxID=280406 RepID=A0AAV2ANX2_9ARAC
MQNHVSAFSTRLLLVIIILTSGEVIQTVRSRSLKINERNSHSNGIIRKKRKLDDVDVINRFELDRVPSLQDAFRNLPPFEKDWINPPPTNFTFHEFSPTDKPVNNSSEFKLELSKDEEHVFSGRYRGNSAVNWWYSVESYSNVTHFNFTDTGSEVDNILEDRTAVTRKQDDDHVVSRVPGLRSGRWSTFDEVVLESPTTPGVTVTLPPQVETPNVTTRYILLQSGRIVAINVTSVSNVFKSTSGSSSGNKSSLPPVYFGARIRKNNSSASNNLNEINKRPNVESTDLKPPVHSGPNRVNTQASPEKLQNLRYNSFVSKPPTLIRSNVLTPPPEIRRSTISERLHNTRVDFPTTNSPPSGLSSIRSATITTNVMKPAVYDIIRTNFQTLPEKLHNLTDNVITYSPSPGFSTSYTPPPTLRMQAFPERLQDLRIDPITTKSPNIEEIPRTRTIVLTPPPIIRANIITETPMTSEKVEPTKGSVSTLAPERIFLSTILPETSTNPTTETVKIMNTVTKKVFEALTPTKPVSIIPHPDPSTTQRSRGPTQVTTKQPLVLPSTSISTSPTPKTTKAEVFSRGKPTTQIPPSLSYSLPPKNIIETIFEVFQPETSELPFLVVTFDSLKKQLPTIVPPVEVTSVENGRINRERVGRLIESNVEYEKVRSTKPSLIHYNFNPYHRTSVASIQDSPATRVLTTTWNRNRGSSNIQVTPPVNSIAAKDFKPTESLPKLQHDFVRINAVTPPTTPAIAPPSPLANPATTTRRPRYRGVPLILMSSTVQKGYLQVDFDLGKSQKSEGAKSGDLVSLSFVTNKPTVPPKTVPPPSPTTSRKPRQNQGFHLRNSIGFQTIPPAAFLDRRSLPGLTTSAPDIKAITEEEMRMDQVFRFEPTRKNAARADHLQNLPTPGVTPAYTIQWFRPTTRQARLTSTKPTVPRTIPSTRSPRRLEERVRPVPSLPLKETNSRNRNSQRQRSQLLTEAEQDKSASTSTAKPFRVYYFEPKRKKQRKNNLTTDPPQTPRDRIATERVKSTTSIPLWRARGDHPQRAPRVLNESPRRNQPSIARSATPSAPIQGINGLTKHQDRSRRGRARVISLQTASPVSTTQAIPTVHLPSKKPWYSPFIRHQPNVGTTVLTTNNYRATATPSLSRSTKAIPVDSFPLPPGDSFEEVIFQPLEIRRIN